MQVLPPVHFAPQAPQLSLLFFGLTQAPLHSRLAPGQASWAQTPALQTSLPAQAFPHMPQLAESVMVLVQTLLHAVWPVGQAHCPC